jgi:hypothetical protein
MLSFNYSGVTPDVSRYDAHRWHVPYRIELVSTGEGEDAVEQYRYQTLLMDHHPTDDDIRAAIARRLNAEVGAYIYGQYDAGTQQTLQALVTMDTVPQPVKEDILTIWPWIQSALAYYYTKKAEVMGAADPKAVTWDFTQFYATKPDVTLPGIMAALAE